MLFFLHMLKGFPMVQNQNLNRRISRIEEKYGISGNDEIVEIPLDDGQVYRATRQQLNEFRKWLKSRENDGQETITTD
jgi:hypothetical protein